MAPRPAPGDHPRYPSRGDRRPAPRPRPAGPRRRARARAPAQRRVLGNLLTPLAPAALPAVAVACLLGQQVIGDSALTVFDVTEVSVRQARVDDRRLGRVNATVRVAMVLAQLVATLGGGLLAEAIGLRGATFVSPFCALLGVLAVLASPVRGLKKPDAAPA